MKKSLFCFMCFVAIFTISAQSIYVGVGNYADIVEREKTGTLTAADKKYSITAAKLTMQLLEQLKEKGATYGFTVEESKNIFTKPAYLSINIDSYNCQIELYTSPEDPLLSETFNNGHPYKINFNKPHTAETNQKALQSILFNAEVILAQYAQILKAQTTSTQTEPPVFIDSFTPRKYLSQELPLEPLSQVQAIAARNDFSFAVCDNTCIRFYDFAGSIVGNATKQLPLEAVTSGAVSSNNGVNWNVDCPDGEMILVGNSNIDSVYTFNAKNILTDKKTYYFPKKHAQLFFTDNGIPYMYQTKKDFSIMNESGNEQVKITELYANQFKIKNNAIYKKHHQQNYLVVSDFDGNRKKIIYLPSSASFETVSCITDDNEIILSCIENDKTNFVCYTADGLLKWKLPINEESVTLADCKNGVYYFSAENGKIIRYAESTSSLPASLKKISAYNQQIAKNPIKNNALYLLIADEYDAQNGTYLAYEALRQYLVYNPADAKTAEKKLNKEIDLRKKTVAEKVANIFTTYEEVGTFAAKSSASPVIIEIETLLKLRPNDKELLDQYSKLTALFGSESSTKAEAEITVTSIELSVLFPALKDAYATIPAGFMTVTNTSSQEVTNVSVSCYIKKYMDYESSADTIKTLKPGETTTITLPIALNQEVMNITENTNVQMRFTAKWQANQNEKKLNIIRPVTIYRKSSMLWNDSAMLSCFIMPNDPTVSKFALTTLTAEQSPQFISRNFRNAVNLANTIGSIPLVYVPDPVTPVSNVIDNQFAVDSVRFPAETLKFKSGDCDDMTTLFCSVLESAGIPCAFITIPGHILAAFELDVKSNFVWESFSKTNEYLILKNDGRLWIPIETTMLSKGFVASWKKASQVLSTTKIEDFVIIAKERTLYPPVAADIREAIITLATNAQRQNTKDQEQIATLIEATLKPFESVTDGKKINTVAHLYYLLGDNTKAINVLQTYLSHNPNYVPASKNLAFLTAQKGNSNELPSATLGAANEKASLPSFFEWQE